MSNTEQTGGMDGPATPSSPVSDPANDCLIFGFGVAFLAVAIMVFYVLVASWPILGDPVGAVPSKTFKAFSLFSSGPYENWAPDQRMFLTVIAAGAVGSLIHMLTSFGDYVGNRRLSVNWLWWFVLRMPIGIALAIISYLLLRGGLIVPTLQATADKDMQAATTLLNPYGIAAFAALAGMFSKQATDKLREIFETVFTAQKPVPRADPLKGKPGIAVEPEKLTIGKVEVLVVTGTGFKADTKATIDGKQRDVAWVSDTQIKVTPAAEDVAKAGKLNLVITNPNKDTFEKIIEVVAPGAAGKPVTPDKPVTPSPSTAKPVISSTDPKELTTTGTKSLAVIGEGFQNNCTATINGESRVVAAGGSDKKITLTLQEKDLAAPSPLKLVVKNPDGQASDAHDIPIK